MPLNAEQIEKAQAELAGLLDKHIDSSNKRFDELDKQHQAKIAELGKELAASKEAEVQRFQRLSDIKAAVRAGSGRRRNAVLSREAAEELGELATAMMNGNPARLSRFGVAGSRDQVEAHQQRLETAGVKPERAATVIDSESIGLGYLIDPTFTEQILEYQERTGVAEGRMDIQPTSGYGSQVRDDDAAEDVYFPGLGQSPPDSAVPAGGTINHQVTPWVRALDIPQFMFGPVTRVSLGEYIARAMARAFNRGQDRIVFRGTGAVSDQQHHGIFAADAGNPNPTPSVVATAGDNTIAKALAKLPTLLAKAIGQFPTWIDNYGDLAIYAHRSIFWNTIGLVDSQGRPLANIWPHDAPARRTLLGLPFEDVVGLPSEASGDGASVDFLAVGSLSAHTACYRVPPGYQLLMTTDVNKALKKSIIAVNYQRVQVKQRLAMRKLRTAA